jgi:hypothetical protein
MALYHGHDCSLGGCGCHSARIATAKRIVWTLRGGSILSLLSGGDAAGLVYAFDF